MSNSGIEYVDRAWHVVWGCSAKVSTGCKECWAEYFARRQGRDFRRVELASEKVLWAPERWRRSGTVFVAPMGDLFDPAVPDKFIHGVFLSMANAPRQRFLVLTKQSERMRDVINILHGVWEAEQWPAGDNVALGVSVENQETAYRRLDDLLATRCKLRWVSYEPALGRVDFGQWLPLHQLGSVSIGRYPALDWIVIGGESARPRRLARPVHIRWFYRTVIDCGAASVPIYVKQLGSACAASHGWRDPRGANLAEWPPALRVRQELHWPAVVDG